MHLIEIPEAGIKVNMPSELAECDTREYIEMCALIFRYQTGQIDYDDMLIQAVYKLLNLKPSKKELPVEDQWQMHGNLSLLSELVKEFFTEDEDRLIVKQNYINNPVPSYKPMLAEYFGPSDSFMNVKHGEYVDALRMMYNFQATGDVEFLYIISAILYRPKRKDLDAWKQSSKYDGDFREPYNPKAIDARAEVFKVEMPIGFIYGVYLLFTSFQIYIKTARIMWGGQEIDLSIIFDAGSSENEGDAVPGIGMDSITFSIAETGAFGTVEQMRDTNNWEILIRMYDIRKRDMDYQSKMKQNDQSSQT